MKVYQFYIEKDDDVKEINVVSKNIYTALDCIKTHIGGEYSINNVKLSYSNFYIHNVIDKGSMFQISIQKRVDDIVNIVIISCDIYSAVDYVENQEYFQNGYQIINITNLANNIIIDGALNGVDV